MSETQLVGAAAVEKPPATPRRRPIDLSSSGGYFLGLLLLALVAFWPTYFSQLESSSGYTHLHAATATLWLLFLIAQPVAIRTRRRALHRVLGRVSYGLAAAVVLSIVLLAHSRITSLTGLSFSFQTYLLYLQLSLAVLFGVSYGLAVATRDVVAYHARFMICTGLTLIDPIVVRLLIWADSTPDWNYQWLTFGLTDLVLLLLIWADRNSRKGRWIFPMMLGVFVLAQLPAVVGVTNLVWWQEFARWFADLPLT